MIISAILSFFTLIVTLHYRHDTIYLIPIIALVHECALNISMTLGLGDGFIGFQTISISIVLFSSLRHRIYNSINLSKILVIGVLAIYLSSINMSIDLFSLITRSLGFINLYLIVLVGLSINRDDMRLERIKQILWISLKFYVGFILFCSVLKTGPNHYNTGWIYGLRFEQYYSGPLYLVCLVFLSEKKELSRNKYWILALLIIVLLTLRRTSYIILAVGMMSFIFFTAEGRQYLRISLIGLCIASMVVKFTGLGDARQSEFEDGYQLQEEGRFLEMTLVYETLSKNDALLFGMPFFLDDRGRYGFHHDQRPIHGSLTKYFFGGGYVGLTLVLLVLTSFIPGGKWIKHYGIQQNWAKLNTLRVGLVLIFFLVSITGGMGTGNGISYTLPLLFIVSLLK